MSKVMQAMKYERLKKYKEDQFRRISGVKRATFEKMIAILSAAQREKLSKGGRKPKLSLENMLLATLEYWREYRTYANIAASYGIHESNIYHTIKWVENILIQDGTFSLPGKKTLRGTDVNYEIVLIDATESPIQRPKKGKESTIQARKSNIR